MCGTCDTADALAVVAEAHRVASSLAAELLGEPVAKAMDLGTARGFDRAVASLAAELRRQGGRSERDAVRAAVDVLDVAAEVLKPAIVAGAHAIILGHNHPSGDPKPSREDLAMTRTLREAGDLLGIQVLDHVVVTEDGASWSMLERGQL